ncbi:MAG: hypothetical protein KatS3mg031_0845 [Chitinophagales bacterium]|nr:MAG: hypothetical protein KatS3mg031_0845 [Chitinophagales bacterium]
MKRLTTLFALFCFLICAQQTQAQSKKLIWYGLDFTKAKMIGSLGFSDPEKIRDYYFDAWNALILNEKEKYDIAKFYKKPVAYDISRVKERNNTVDAFELIIDDSYSITEEDVRQVVKNYVGGEGVGLLYVVESFDKTKEKAYIWVVLFNASSGEIIKTARFAGKPGGFGLRNYWAGAILDIMENSGKVYRSIQF